MCVRASVRVCAHETVNITVFKLIFLKGHLRDIICLLDQNNNFLFFILNILNIIYIYLILLYIGTI